MGFLYFIILIGVLIFVHELGHFLVAKFFDVKVLRFSIGFGPAILSYQKGETEYVICALPLGGYVQMLGADLESIEELPPEDQARALMKKPIWKRSLIVLAGPAANLILPIAIYFIVGMGQTMVPPSVVGEVFVDTPAAEAGLQSGDRITAINGQPIDYWHQVLHRVSKSYDKTLELTYERDGEETTISVAPEKKTSTDTMALDQRTYGMLGIHLGTYGTTVAVVDPEGPAAEGGLRSFDRIIAINDTPINRYDELEAAVRNSAGKPLEMIVLRRQPIDVDFGRFYGQEAETATVTPRKSNGAYRIGIDRADMYLAVVEEDSPAAQAGLRQGDKLLAIDGEQYNNWSMLAQHINNSINQEIVDRDENGDKEEDELEPAFELEVQRGASVFTVTLEPAVIGFTDDRKQQHYRIYIGWGQMRDLVYPEEIYFPFFQRMSHSFTDGVRQTVRFANVIRIGIQRLIQGRLPKESLGGPIMIGELAAQAGRAGWEPFLQMMALISINLAIINLLPIPVLDGGHLLLFALEALKRGPLSYRTRQIAAYIGFVFIIFLMLLVFKTDIEWIWPRIVEYFDSG
ncbi:MAG: RIP metalloprotease RseP [Bradymonadaceae bacterium]